MPDFIQTFIDIINYDASLVINPDSVIIQPHSTKVFGTFLTSKVSFKMLTNRRYYTKSYSLLTSPDLLRIRINDEPIIIYAVDDYPLFSFDTRINFKNGETIDYYKAVCQETLVDEEDITTSDIFSYYDIFYILMNNSEFLAALSNLGYDGPFILPTAHLGMPPSDLLNLVSKIEWKFRIRLNNKSFYTQVFDWIDLYVSGNSTVDLISNQSQVPGLQDWISEITEISPPESSSSSSSTRIL